MEKIKQIDDDKLILTDEENNEYIFNISFTYKNDERNAEYVFFYTDENPDEVMFIKWGENNEAIYVDDEEELAEIEEVFNAFNEDPKIQSIK